MARISPLVGSMMMAVPDSAPLFFTASSRIRSTIAWISRSMVSTRLEPGGTLGTSCINVGSVGMAILTGFPASKSL